jgi:predicted CXXCH cytochrome family protein
MAVPGQWCYRAILVGLLTLSIAFFQALAQQPAPNTRPSAGQGYVGSEACSSCHADIYRSYSLTAMARASGPAAQQLIPGEFQHAASGVHYRVYIENGDAWLSFLRPGDPSVSGTRRLLYFIGSGHRGRTYLFAVDGFVFEAPINWYAQKGVWDMAPAYQSSRQIPLSLPALPSCLSCHTSNAQSPVPGTENKYALPLFAHAGITCERCHGPGAAHASAGAAARIVNPARLSPTRRDAICMQCHLEANVAIEQPGKHLADYRPGENLSDYVHYYLLPQEGAQPIRALGQSEALALSVCRQKSGAKMSCTSCHDPHSSPSAEQRVSYYRAKCLACHGEPFAAKHHADQLDCTSCHMPRTNSADVAHTQATDHRILRLPLMPLQGMASNAAPHLVRFPPEAMQVSSESAGNDDPRDLALAWESLAENGMPGAASEAETSLRKAVTDKTDDPALLSGLAFVELQQGENQKARELYERALKSDPTLIDALANLGVLDARDGHVERAVRLWQDTFVRAPSRSPIGMNLARIYCSAKQLDKARQYVTRVLQFNPDLPQAKALIRELSADSPKCDVR